MANEIRRRYDFVAGGLSAGMLTSDTLMSSAGLADLPAVGATEQVALTLWRTDILGRVTQKEVVYVTAHTAAAATATVTRGREGTTAQTWLSGDRWSLTSISSDALIVCTSATRPSQPYTGMEIYETDSGARLIYTGTAWDGSLHSVGAAGANVNSVAMQKGSVISPTNILYALSHRSTDKDLLLFGYDGTTFRNFFFCDWTNLAFAVHQKLDMGQNDIRLHSATNTDHKLKYMATAPGGAGDGPVLFGFNKGHLATTQGGELWQFAWQNNGQCTARGSLACSGISNNGNISTGQGRGFSQARFHFSGDGNDLHVNWGAGLQFYVDVTNVKTFVIDHPLDKARHLIHACIEGPEAAVIYRGQAQLEGGWVEIPLPDYFEALCAEEGRSVQLTCIADDPADEWCPVLHATYPRNGKFYVGLGSGMVINDQRFWWEVKAVRKDVAALQVEPLRKDVVVHGDGPYTYYKEK
jgi:hypothetical protein